MGYYIISIIVFLAFLIHLLLLLIEMLKRDTSYNQNIVVHGGKVVGDTQEDMSGRLMYGINDQSDTLVVSSAPRPQVTSDVNAVYVRLHQVVTGVDYDYMLVNQMMIGRFMQGSKAEIQINDARVSQRHCQIYRQGEQLYLQDLGSTNHTFLNGCMLEGAMPLAYGDMIQVGDSIFQFQCFV